MSTKLKLIYKGEVIEASEDHEFWKIEFSDGTEKRLLLHINADKDEVWMWESGRIDDRSLEIGKLIEGVS